MLPLHIVQSSSRDSALGELFKNGLHGKTGLCLQVESPKLAVCEGGGTELAAGDGMSTEAATVEGASMSADDEATSQALERVESVGNVACYLNDTFEVCAVLPNSPAAQFHPGLLPSPACWT